MKYYNLHNHSTFSTLDACIKIDDLVSFAKSKGLGAVTITDHGTLSGAYKLWDKCNQENIKPIIGLEAYFVDDVNKDEATVDYSYSHLVLLCKNEVGWKNLKILQSLAWHDGYHKKPRIDYRMLKKHSEGLIALSACCGGLVGAILLKNSYYELLTSAERKVAIHKRIKKFKKIFGDDFYLELMLNEMPEQKLVNKKCLFLSKKYNIRTVITSDSHYVGKEDCELHDIVKCTQFRSLLSDEDNGTYSIRELYLATYKDLKRFYKKYHSYIPSEKFVESIYVALEITESIDKFPITVTESALPVFDENAEGLLSQLCQEGAKKLIGKLNKKYNKRLKYELSVINKLGMADYFLIVWDIAREARARNIPFNTRGSVAGSLVAYLIGISWIDPIRFDTAFERFLTEDRISLPDIDIDLGKERREELLQYLREKYGDGAVAHIVNFTVYKPKSAIKDVSRVFGIPFHVVNKVTKTIPDNVEDWESLNYTGELQGFFDKNPEIEEYSKELIGIVRARGIHASGVIVTPGDIVNWAPVAWSLQGENVKEKVTEFDMYDLEDMNVLKLDFLGQNTLDVIQHTLDIIQGDMRTFDDLYRHILENLDDKKVYEEIQKGNLVGTFQMGTSEGMKKLIVDMIPDDIEDIITCIALYRSAVLSIGAHTKYINRRFGREDVEYLHPKMERVLSGTNGIILWQEQSMYLAVVLAGFTRTESDHFRKGIKQKDISKFKKWEERFIAGCKKHSKIDKDLAEEIWNEIVQWSSYGFNRSHSSSYAVISYITMWLKIYYPEQFMTALLSRNTDEDDKLTVYLKEVRRLNLKLVMPSIINSEDNFIYKNNKILYPLSVIKNVGENAIKNILEVRKNGKFKGVEDFYERVNKRVVNVRVVDSLIFAGCFRRFGSINKVYNKFDRLRSNPNQIRVLYCNVCKLKYPVSYTKKQVENGVVCPECGFTRVITEPSLIRKKKFNLAYCRNQIFGFIIDNPLKNYLGDFINNDVTNLNEVNELPDGTKIKIGALVVRIKKHVDKNGNEMAFVTLTDGDNNYDLIIFSSSWGEYSDVVKKGRVYIFNVKISDTKFILNSGASIIDLGTKANV